MGRLGVRGTNTNFGFSAEGRAFVLELWEFAAFIANSLVFLLIGLTAAPGAIPASWMGTARRGYYSGDGRAGGNGLSVEPAFWLVAMED